MADLVYPPVIFAVKAFWKYLGLKFDFRGQEHLPHAGKGGGAVLAINHIGYLDFALAGTAALPMKRYIRFMAKKEIFDHKIAGPLMRGMHHISVDRSAGSSALAAALRALRSGEIIGIFPEGTISRSFEIAEMKSGAVRLAQGAGVPVIPVAVWGSQRIVTKKRKPDFKRHKHPITVIFGEPIVVPKGADIPAEEEKLREAMLALLHQAQANYPDDPKGQWWAPLRLGGTAPSPEQVQREYEAYKLEKAEKAAKAAEAANRVENDPKIEKE
jgi:1-acyl-sn-glycerol-3-phosphate acyltransferase